MTLEEVHAVCNTKRSTRNKRSTSSQPDNRSTSPQPGPSSAKQSKLSEPGTDSSFQTIFPPLSRLAKFYSKGKSIVCQH